MPPKRERTLRDELIRRGLTIEQAAVLAELRPTTLSRLMAGKTRAQPKTVVALARAFQISARTMRDMVDAHWYAQHPDENPQRQA